VPPGLLEEVFALNEELDEIREAREAGTPAHQLRARLEKARRPIEIKREAHEREVETLSAAWDRQAESGDDAGRQATLRALRDRLLERNYINNLLATIDRESSVLGPQSPVGVAEEPKTVDRRP
jgi:molecular chaperone HscB